MPHFICNTCGTQYAESAAPPPACPICDDERQYVPPSGQTWTTHDALSKRATNTWKELEPNLLSIVTVPAFGIGQRAMLLRTPHGNFLWDCISLVDRATVEIVNALGGIAGIAISHPHYYSSLVEWSRAFGNVPVHIHEADREWIMRPDPCVQFWSGATKPLAPGVMLVCAGGHYPGGTVLHWADGAQGRGALLTGDIVQVVQDRRTVSFMWSFPNFIPLSAPRVEGVVKALEPFAYDRIHGAFDHRTIWSDGKAVVARSARRYLDLIRGDGKYELK